MKLILMASVPCKRFDFAPRCEDGRGGWAFSQFGADRYVAQPANLGLKLGLAVWASPAVAGSYIESSMLVANTADSEIGSSVLDWKHPNEGGAHHSSGSVFEWIQDVECPVSRNELIAVSVQVKLSTQAGFLPVEGNAYVHVTCRDTNSELVTPDDYSKSLRDEKRSWSW